MKSWITFVGEGRSGHTIVSAILGSHPNIRMAEEQKYIGKWVRENWTREQVLDHLFKSGEGRARKLLGFPDITAVKNPLLSIGDKCGWDSVMEVKKREYAGNILADFSEFIKLPVKVLITLRNPQDNISAWYQSDKYKRMLPDDELRCRRMIRRYKRFYDVAEQIVKGHDNFILNNEELIKDPIYTITNLCVWLDVPCERSWLEMCASKVFKKPNERRHLLPWPEGYKEDRLDGWLTENSLMGYYR